jgi:chaperone required for assembly of F1-ATPase
MRDILNPDFAPSDPNPMKRAQTAMARQALPKRFYKAVTVGETDAGYAILLDGRQARTPGRNLLALSTHAGASLLAAEWEAQAEVVDPASMHATRIANTAIDSVGDRLVEVQADIAGYAASDLVCYRAGETEGLARAQEAAWGPVVRWAEHALGARFILVEGVMHRPQSDAALAAVRDAVCAQTHVVRLAALHVMTTISGSCLLALMAEAGSVSPEDAWTAASVDEDWNARFWGQDADAQARQARRRDEFIAAARLLKSLK